MAGLGTGKCLRNLQEHPGTTHKIIGYSLIGGKTMDEKLFGKNLARSFDTFNALSYLKDIHKASKVF